MEFKLEKKTLDDFKRLRNDIDTYEKSKNKTAGMLAITDYIKAQLTRFETFDPNKPYHLAETGPFLVFEHLLNSLPGSFLVLDYIQLSILAGAALAFVLVGLALTTPAAYVQFGLAALPLAIFLVGLMQLRFGLSLSVQTAEKDMVLESEKLNKTIPTINKKAAALCKFHEIETLKAAMQQDPSLDFEKKYSNKPKGAAPIAPDTKVNRWMLPVVYSILNQNTNSDMTLNERIHWLDIAEMVDKNNAPDAKKTVANARGTYTSFFPSNELLQHRKQIIDRLNTYVEQEKCYQAEFNL